jgi:hypothetical protein
MLFCSVLFLYLIINQIISFWYSIQFIPRSTTTTNKNKNNNKTKSAFFFLSSFLSFFFPESNSSSISSTIIILVLLDVRCVIYRTFSITSFIEPISWYKIESNTVVLSLLLSQPSLSLSASLYFFQLSIIEFINHSLLT